MQAKSGDRPLVANNLSDNVVLLDAASSRILESFDVSTSKCVPAATPTLSSPTGRARKAWVSLAKRVN
jgi:hypothetical protein